MNPTPKEVELAVRVFALSVKIVYDMADKPSPHPQEEYHAAEYLDEMETLLLHQVLTDFPDVSSGEEFLSSCGLDYLSERLQKMAEQWECEL